MKPNSNLNHLQQLLFHTIPPLLDHNLFWCYKKRAPKPLIGSWSAKYTIHIYSFYIANLVFGPDTIRSAPFAWFMLVIFYYSFPWDGKIFLQAWGSAISPSTTKRIIEPQTHGTQEDFKTNKFVIWKIKNCQINPRSQLNTSRPSKSVHISWMWHYIPYLSIPLYTINWCKRFSRVSACIQHFYF